MDTVSTKSLAEHLTMLATMLSADAMKLSALGVESRRDLAKEAAALKLLAERLWLTAGEVPLASIEPKNELRLGRDRRTPPRDRAFSPQLPSAGDGINSASEHKVQCYQIVARG